MPQSKQRRFFLKRLNACLLALPQSILPSLFRGNGKDLLQQSFQNVPDGTKALQGIDLEVEPGEFLALVGPSGCGKTTLLRILGGLEQPSAGGVLINGQNASKLQPKDRDLAMVFQNYALFPHLSVFENLGFGLKARRRPKEEIERAVRPVAERLGLSDLLKRKPNELSGGQRVNGWLSDACSPATRRSTC